jgi:long-chain acyl-CoA synthetase
MVNVFIINHQPLTIARSAFMPRTTDLPRPWLRHYEPTVKPHLRYPKITLPQMLEQTAEKFPKNTALIYFNNLITYTQLLDHVNRLASGLQALGVKKGDRVALMTPNCPQFVTSYFGIMQAGATVVATSPLYTPREAEHQWRDSGAETVIVDRRLYPVVKAVREKLPLKNVILTGIRDYYPAHFATLQKSLRHTSHITHHASGLYRWDELIRNPKSEIRNRLTPSDLACLQYTGGTTGTSKGAMLTQANMVINTHQAVHWLMRGQASQETFVCALPLFHIYAMTVVMLASVLSGSTNILLPRFELKAALNIVRKYHPTLFHGVPTMYVAFNNAPNVEGYGFHSLKCCMSGGAPLPVEVQQKFEALTGGKLVEGYGLTETSPVTHTNPLFGARKVGSIGVPIPDTDAKIVDLETGTRDLPVGEIGEVVIRGPQVMKGYWNKPEETANALRNGWLYTGDIGKMDEDGFFYIVDRKKDMIIAGGFNVYPREVEEVLFEHPKIKEAAVIGVPDAYRGETVKAFVVPQDGATLTPDEIIAFCRERLAAYKVPRLIEFRDALPKTGVGKYLRRALRES